MSLLYCLIILSLIHKSLSWDVDFQPTSVLVSMDEDITIDIKIKGLNPNETIQDIHIKSRNEDNAIVKYKIPIDEISSVSSWQGKFNVSGILIGKTNIYVEILHSGNITEKSNMKLEVKIIRGNPIIDNIFTVLLAVLISFVNINFGAALDLSNLKKILLKPIGPIIGFCCQFIAMPLLSFGLGILIFSDFPEFQLGLFFVGVCPAGGASNIWTLIFKGNLDLSITMTTISTFAAFGMVPFWIFTLGRVIFNKLELGVNKGVPYDSIGYCLIALIIPLGIGVLIQKYLPKVSQILIKIMKPFSIILITFIIIFGILSNFCLFKIFTWRIIIAGLGLPLFGYLIGWITAKLLQQNSADSITIAIETGLQNVGIALFLLRFALPQPDADILTVLVGSIAILTQLSILSLYLIHRIIEWASKYGEKQVYAEVIVKS